MIDSRPHHPCFLCLLAHLPCSRRLVENLSDDRASTEREKEQEMEGYRSSWAFCAHGTCRNHLGYDCYGKSEALRGIPWSKFCFPPRSTAGMYFELYLLTLTDNWTHCVTPTHPHSRGVLYATSKRCPSTWTSCLQNVHQNYPLAFQRPLKDSRHCRCSSPTLTPFRHVRLGPGFQCPP